MRHHNLVVIFIRPKSDHCLGPLLFGQYPLNRLLTLGLSPFGQGCQVRSLSTLVTISSSPIWLWLICWGSFYSMLVHGQYWDNSAGKECFLLSRTVTWSGRPSLDSDGPDNQVKAVCRTCIGKFCVRIYIRTQKWTFTSESTMALSLVWGEGAAR